MAPLSCKHPLEKDTDPNAKKESIVLRGTKMGVNINRILSKERLPIESEYRELRQPRESTMPEELTLYAPISQLHYYS